MEIGVIARLEAQAGIQVKRRVQMFERVFHVAGEAVEGG